jgi:Tol biopolymer transport system component/DNA-binding winged helix-turn-helix (wHTH) protein
MLKVPASLDSGRLYEFGRYRLESAGPLLYCAANVVPLPPKVLEILLVLVRNPGRLIEKRELMDAVWPDVAVEEGNLTQGISLLRKALGEGAEGRSYIETIPKRGYRFTASVNEVRAAQGENLGRAPATTIPRSHSLRRWTPGIFLFLVFGSSLFLLLRHRFASGAEPLLSASPLTTYPGEESMPNFSPDSNQVVFVWNGPAKDNLDIYVKMLGSDSPRRLTFDAAADTSPAWSPDGRRISFIRHLAGGKAQILVIPAIGGPEVKVAETYSSPFWSNLAWSPDGKFLIFSGRDSAPDPSFAEAPPLLFLLVMETGEMRKLTDPHGTWGDGAPAISPDGRTLAFIRELGPGLQDLYLQSISNGLTSAPRLLTSFARLNRGFGGFHVGPSTRPAWTPDGREIVFSCGTCSPNFWRIAVAGSNPARPMNVVAGEPGSFPAVSPDGHRLAFARQTIDRHIWRLDLNREYGPVAGKSKLAASTREEYSPQYSPDGHKIAFISNRSGPAEVWVSGEDGSLPRQLTSLSAPVTGSPRWSFDGNHIVFDSNKEGRFSIYTMDAEGGSRPRRITTGPHDDAVPSWSRDGKSIYFGSNRTGSFQIWRMGVNGEDPTQITKGGGRVAFESLDRRYLYYARTGGTTSLWRVPVGGGEEKMVIPTVLSSAFALTREGIYFVPGPGAGSYSVHFFSFRSGKSRIQCTLDGAPGGGLACSSDGRSILLTVVAEMKSDLMLVENFR